MSKWIWWVGIIIYFIGGVLGVAAVNFAAQSIVSPLSATNLVVSAILSNCILKEPLSIKDIIAIIIIVVGITIVVIFGSNTGNSELTVVDIRDYFSATPYVITILILTAITIIVYIGIKLVERKNYQSDINNKITYGRRFLLFSYAWIAVYLASNNVLFIKASVSIISSSVSSNEALKTNATDFVSYILFILWGVCLFSVEYWRQKALGHFGALYVVPIFAVGCIILESLLGMIFFQEYKNMSMTNAIYFGIGIAVTIIGVIKLSVDVAAVWTKLYDDYIKVSMVEFTDPMTKAKYPQTICYGGACAENYSNFFYKRPAISYNKRFDLFGDDEMEQMVRNGKPYVDKNGNKWSIKNDGKDDEQQKLVDEDSIDYDAD